MNQSILKQWLAALRSGDYKKGHGDLRRDDSYCCLGVLCELAVEAEATARGGTDTYRYGTVSGGTSACDIPTSVAVWAGLPRFARDIPIRFPKGSVRDISQYNDDRTAHNDFNKIADILEWELSE